MKTRKELKLQKHYSPRGLSYYREVPSLQMRGIWLEEAGFKIGESVEVEIQDGRLIIKAKAL